MRIKCLRKDFYQALTLARIGLPAGRPPIPSSVLLEVIPGEGIMNLTTTDLVGAITILVGGMVEAPGSVAVPLKPLLEIVYSLSKGLLVLEDTPNHALKITQGPVTYTMLGTPSESFPPCAPITNATSVTIDRQTLSDAIRKVAFAATTDNTHPALTGTKLELKEKSFTMIAADGFRLSVQHGSLISGIETPHEVIVPTKTLVKLDKLLKHSESDNEVYVKVSDKAISFLTHYNRVVSYLISGAFPNYALLIPDSFHTKITLDRLGFLSLVKNCAIFAKDSDGATYLQATRNKLTVSARSVNLGESCSEISAQVEGEDTRMVLFNGYLREVLSALREEEVSLGIVPPDRFCILPVGGSGYVHRIMPMYVQW